MALIRHRLLEIQGERHGGLDSQHGRRGQAAAALAQLRFLTEYVQITVVDRVVAALGVPDARLRVTLISSYLVGVSTTRYLLRIEPLASATDDQVVALVGPAIQALLDPTRKPGE